MRKFLILLLSIFTCLFCFSGCAYNNSDKEYKCNCKIYAKVFSYNSSNQNSITLPHENCEIIGVNSYCIGTYQPTHYTCIIYIDHQCQN